MGRLVYRDANTSVDIDDRLLAHLRVVFANRLRRKEPFVFTYSRPGLGQVSLWVAPAIPIMFQFYGSRAPQLAPDLLEKMMREASSADGIFLHDRYDELAEVR